MSEDARSSTPAATGEGPEYASSSPIPVPRAERLAARTAGGKKQDGDVRQQVVMERRAFGSPTSRLARMFTRKKAEDAEEAAPADGETATARDGNEPANDGDVQAEDAHDEGMEQGVGSKEAPAEEADAEGGDDKQPAPGGGAEPAVAAPAAAAPAAAAPAVAAPAPSRWKFGFGRTQKIPAAGDGAAASAASGDRQQGKGNEAARGMEGEAASSSRAGATAAEATPPAAEQAPAQAAAQASPQSTSFQSFRKNLAKKMFGPVWKPPPPGSQPQPPDAPSNGAEQPSEELAQAGEEGKAKQPDEEDKGGPPRAKSRAAPRPQASVATQRVPGAGKSPTAAEGAEQSERAEGAAAKLDERFSDEEPAEEAGRKRGFFRNVFSRNQKAGIGREAKASAGGDGEKAAPDTPTSPAESPPGAPKQAGFPDESPSSSAVAAKASPSRGLFRNVFLRKSQNKEEAPAPSTAAASPPEHAFKGRPSPGGNAAVVDDAGDAPATPISGALREQERARKLRSSAQKQGGQSATSTGGGEDTGKAGPAYAQASRSGRRRKSPQSAGDEGDPAAASAMGVARDGARGTRGAREGGPPQGDEGPGGAGDGEQGEEREAGLRQGLKPRRRARDVTERADAADGDGSQLQRPRSAERRAADSTFDGNGDDSMGKVPPARRARGRARETETKPAPNVSPEDPDASAGRGTMEGSSRGRKEAPSRPLEEVEEEAVPAAVPTRRRGAEERGRAAAVEEDLPDVEGDTLASRSKRAEEAGGEQLSQAKAGRRGGQERASDRDRQAARGRWEDESVAEEGGRRRQGTRGHGKGSAHAGEGGGGDAEENQRSRAEGSSKGRREQEAADEGSRRGAPPSASIPAAAAGAESEVGATPSSPGARASITQPERQRSQHRRDQRHLKVEGPRAGTPTPGAAASGDAAGSVDAASMLMSALDAAIPAAPELTPETQEREEAARRERAAVLIQAHIRGYRARKAHPLVRRQMRLDMEARDWAAKWDAELLRKAGSAPPGDVCQLVVHRTDVLQPDLAMTQPLVRVHFVDAASGHYWEKGDKARAAVQARETVGYILPAQTKPFDLRARVKKVFAAEWEEHLLVDQDVRQLLERSNATVAADATSGLTAGAGSRPTSELLLLFELLQLPQTFSSFQRRKVPANRLNPDGSYRVAWAFLKPKPPLLMAGSNPARLQMYSYAKGRHVPKPPLAAGGAAGTPHPSGSPSPPEVYYHWLHLQAQRQLHRTPSGETLLPPALLYPSSLYISVLAVPRPAPSVVVASARAGGTRGAALPMQVERGRLPVGQLLKAYKRVHLVGAKALVEIQEPAAGDEEAGKEEAMVIQRPVRAPTDPCIIPNALETCIKTGIKSCVAVRFSHRGSYVAAACSDGLLFPIRIFTVTGKPLMVFKGGGETSHGPSLVMGDAASGLLPPYG
eukprot:jgi/Mesvir1/3572/Mv25066-RA.1